LQTFPFYDLSQFLQICARLQHGEYVAIERGTLAAIFDNLLSGPSLLIKAREVAETVGLKLQARPDLEQVWFIKPYGDDAQENAPAVA